MTNSAFTIVIGILLDTLNALYDYARRLCRRTFESIGTKVMDKAKKIYKAAVDQRMHDEEIRKAPEIQKALPLDTSLSSFYEYEIINGTPVFVLKERKLPDKEERRTPDKKAWDSFNDLRYRRKESDLSLPGPSRNPRGCPKLLETTHAEDKSKISCYAFSHDDSFFVCGRNDGNISVWNVSNGRLERFLTGPHKFTIGAVAFQTETPAILVSIDHHGWCVKWNVASDPVSYSRSRCVPVWEDSLFVGTEFAVPSLSSDGRYLGFPVYTYVEPRRSELSQKHHLDGSLTRITLSGSLTEGTSPESMLTKFYVVGYVFDLGSSPVVEKENTDPMLVLPVKVDERLNFEDRMLDLMLFSRTGHRLLLTAYELSKPFLVLWPDIRNRNVESYKLQGTRGSFSPDDKYLVTWYRISSSADEYTDFNCYVWTINKLNESNKGDIVAGWHHPYYEGLDPLVLRDPDHAIIHTCGFVGLGSHFGLASCSVSETMKVVIWSLKTADPIHVLKTGFAFDDISPNSLRTLARDAKELDRVPGVNCIGISNDGLWVSAYSPIERIGIVWNAWLGTEILRMTPSSEKAEVGVGMDFLFSQNATKIMLVGKYTSLLWDPSVLRAYNEEHQPLQVLDSSDEEMGMGETLCRFCCDGQGIGLLRVQSFVLDVWHLIPQKRFTLDRRETRTEVHHSRNRRSARTSLQLQAGKYRFCHFALDYSGSHIVTCMGDMSVLLWNIDDLSQCRRIATIASEYRPALDVCFSKTPEGSPSVVICQDQGVFVWISLFSEEIIHRVRSGGITRCKFNAEGTTGVIMSNLYHLKVWDLVSRTMLQEVDYSIPLMRAVRGEVINEHSLQFPSFSPQLGPNAEFCFLGFDITDQPVIAKPTTLPQHLDEVTRNAEESIVTENGEWVFLVGQVNSETDNIALKPKRIPDLSNYIADDRFPPIVYKQDSGADGIMPSTSASRKQAAGGNQTFKLVHLNGDYKPKQMRLPFALNTRGFVSMSIDGRRFAALNMNNQLVVWGTHFTYKHIIQQRWDLMGSSPSNSPSQIDRKLNEYGASLLNHPYKKGRTVIMECVIQKKVELLKRIIAWAKGSEINLSFHGLSAPHNDDKRGKICTATNALDLAVNQRIPYIAEDLLQAMVQGATSETNFARILQQSLVRLSYKYPTLVLKFFRSSEIMRPLCVINISESFFQSRNGYIGVLTDKRLVASPEYVQDLWSRTETKTAKRLREKSNIEIQAEAKVIPYPNIAKIGAEGMLQALLLQRAKHYVYSTPLVKAVTSYKYFAYGRSLLLEDVYHYLFLLLVFTGNCIYIGHLDDDDQKKQPETTTLLAALVGFGNLIRFLKQLHTLWIEQRYNGLLYYARNVQKGIELTSYVLVAFVIPVVSKVSSFQSESLSACMAVASVLLWIKLLYYAQAFKTTGSMVIMMREIIRDIRWFLFVLFAFLVGFGVAFFVLLGRFDRNNGNYDNDDSAESPDVSPSMSPAPSEDTDDNGNSRFFGSTWISLLTMFLLMLSDVGDTVETIKEFELPRSTKVLTILLLISFLAAVAIVLLNLLIAIMGDSFDRVKNHEKSLFLQKKAEVILDMELCLSYARRKKFNARIERYLHVLNPEFRSDMHQSDWEGRLVDIQRRMRQELAENSEKESRDLLEVKTEIQELKSLFLSFLDTKQRDT